MKDNPGYIMKVFISISQLINVWFFGGWPDEMLCARAYRENRVYLMNFLDFIFNRLFSQENHCKECFEWEKRRYDSPLDMRQKYGMDHRFSVDR